MTEVAFLDGDKRLLSASRDGTILIWDISAIIEREFDVKVKEGFFADASWFPHGIQLGGWFADTAKPFKFKYPGLVLPPDFKPLDWVIPDGDGEDSDKESGSGDKVNNTVIPEPRTEVYKERCNT